jgi:hypothetical protein
VKLLQDEREYLADVTERAKALREVFDGNGANVDKARKELAGFIGQPGRLLDLLRRCDRLYGLGDHTHRRLDWIGGEWERFPQGYPTIWDSLADVEVLADLERCLGQVDGETASERVKSQESNRVPWNESDPAYYPNKNAIADANKAGTDHDTKDLRDLNPDKLNKLLRSRRGRTIRFMSREKPPRGKVHRNDWHKYLQRLIGDQNAFEEAVEEAVTNRLDDEPPTRGA